MSIMDLQLKMIHTMCVCVCVLSQSAVLDSVTPWTVACQPLPSMGFPRQECWRGLPLPNPGIEPMFPALAGGFFTADPPGKPHVDMHSSFSHDHQNLEAAKMYFSRRMDQ